MRCAFAWAKQPKILSDSLEAFFEIYVDIPYNLSQIVPIRNMIRASKQLNQLLYENSNGIRFLYDELRKKGSFTYDKAVKLFAPITEKGQEILVHDMRKLFVYSQMTNLKDNSNPEKYFSLVFVELLEFICRVSHSYWNTRRENDQPRTDVSVTPYPSGIAYEVEDVLRALFEKRKEKAEAGKKMRAQFV